MTNLTVLITNTALADRAGTELYVRDLGIALLKRGHRPVVYSPVLGQVAQEIRSRSIPVVDDLARLSEAPDLIHAHHHLEAMTALLHFPAVPAVYCCHGWLPWEEAPPVFPRILRYVAVDDTCYDRLVREHAIPPDRASVVLNFVDLDRFKPRGPLPMRPRRALLVSNENGAHVDAVRMACGGRGLALDVIGRAFGHTAAPEDVLGQYDLVFAKARSALEALAVGTAVVLAAAVGIGPMVTTTELDRLRRLNFGLRALRKSFTPESVAEEIDRYDASDAEHVSRRVREVADGDVIVDQLLGVYEAALGEWHASAPNGADPELRAGARYLRWLSVNYRSLTHELQTQRQRAAHAEGERVRMLQSRFWKARLVWGRLTGR